MLTASILPVQELSHCYEHMPFESKLDSHIYAIVLLYCLKFSNEFKFSYERMSSINGISISQVVLAIFFVCVNGWMFIFVQSSIKVRS